MAIREEAGGFILENTWIRRRVEVRWWEIEAEDAFRS